MPTTAAPATTRTTRQPMASFFIIGSLRERRCYTPSGPVLPNENVRLPRRAPGRGISLGLWMPRRRSRSRGAFCLPPSALSSLIRDSTLTRAVVDVVLGIDLPHRMFALAFFLRLRGDARDARDDEQRVRDLHRDADVAADGGDGTVDVHGQRLPLGQRGDDELHGADHLDVPTLDLQLQRHLEEARGPWITGMEPMAEPGDRLAGLQAPVHDPGRGVAIGRPPAHELQPRVQELHAA